MKFKDLLHRASLYVATGLSLLSLEQAIASNVNGSTRSIPQMSPVQAHVFLIDKNTGDTTKAESNIAGNFSMNINPGNYTLEVAANHHYFYQDTSFVLNGDSTLDLRVIRGEYDNGTPILQSTHFQSNGSILDFAKDQYVRYDASPGRHDVINWPSTRRRLYVTGINDSASRANLDYTLALNESLSVSGIYYDEQLTDSAGGIRIYGVPAGDPLLEGGTAITKRELNTISSTPLIQEYRGARIYMINNAGTIPIKRFSDELLHTDGQEHFSLDSTHLLTFGLIQSFATQTTFDESWIRDMKQRMIVGTDWRNHKDTMRTITISPIIPVSYTSGWNMVSVPTKESNMAASAVFPEKVGSAFRYNGGYQSSDTLENGVGYWIKLNEALNKEFSGTQITKDTLDLMNRWNIIGSISAPVPVDSIEQNPPGIIQSQYFKYSGGIYQIADTLQPGEAYWIKSLEGKILLKKPSK